MESLLCRLKNVNSKDDHQKHNDLQSNYINQVSNSLEYNRNALFSSIPKPLHDKIRKVQDSYSNSYNSNIFVPSSYESSDYPNQILINIRQGTNDNDSNYD